MLKKPQLFFQLPNSFIACTVFSCPVTVFFKTLFKLFKFLFNFSKSL